MLIVNGHIITFLIHQVYFKKKTKLKLTVCLVLLNIMKKLIYKQTTVLLVLCIVSQKMKTTIIVSSHVN